MPAVVFKKRMASSQTNGIRRKKPIVIEDEPKDESDESSDPENTEIHRVKRIKKLGNVGISNEKDKKNDIGKNDSGVAVKYMSNTQNNGQDEATKENIFYKIEREAALETLEERKKISQDSADKNDNIYRGEAGYKKYNSSTDNKPKFGPIKAATNIRSSTTVDYQPDVCKDYKLTGYCGYGDSCKFLHSREDYKAGWLLDKEWEKAKNGDETTEKEEEEEVPDIPFKCPICKEDYKSPVVTPCKHYFCEECFLTEYRKKPGCFICNKPTGGIIRPAKEIVKLLKEKEKRQTA